MDKSFSLHFNPITDIKTIKEYEYEVERLRKENFAIKHELSHYKNNNNEVSSDLRKLLEDSRKSIDILEDDKSALAKKFEDESKALKEKLSNMENENMRLINCIENINDENEKVREDNQKLCDFISKQQGGNKNSDDVSNEAKNLYERLLKAESDVQEKQKELLSIESMYKVKVADLEEKIDSKVKEFGIVSNEKSDLERRLKKCEDEFSEAHKDFSKREMELSKVENYMRELEMTLSDKERKIEDLRENENSYKEELSRVSNRFSYEQTARVEREKENSMLKNQLLEAQNVLKRYEREFDNIRMQAEEKESMVRKRLQSLNFKESELENMYKQEMRRYEEENRELRNQFHVLKNRYQDYVNKIREDVDCNAGKVNRIKKIFLSLKKPIQDLVLSRSLFAENQKKALEEKQEIKRDRDAVANELQDVKIGIARLEEKAFLSDRCLSFLESIGLTKKEKHEKVVLHFSKMYQEMLDKISVMEKEIGEVTYFAQNNKNIHHSRTLKLLDNFTKEFSSAKMELEECKNYLERKNKEVKTMKKEKMDFNNKLRVAERKKFELQDVLSRMRDRYNNVEKELKSKNDIISRLQTKIDVHLS